MTSSIRENDADVLDLGPKIADDYFTPIRYAARVADHSKHAVEFGVATGTTLKIIAQYMSVTGFDSFEGLPEDWREGFPKGFFAQKPPHVPDAELVKGWFEDSLPVWIQNNTDKVNDLGLIHIDCDLYSSTVTILRNLEPYIKPGVVICFDEYHGYPGWEAHEFKAWREFVCMNKTDFEVLGHGPEQLIVRIK